MIRKRLKIKSVIFKYTGTAREFQNFLEVLVHDYLKTDVFSTNLKEKAGDNVES